jgi:ABC-type transporter Mla subunit MlaD
MRKDPNAIKAGLFILLSFAGAVGIAVSVPGVIHWFEPNQMRIVRFDLSDDIGGLRVGDDVRIGGYTVGNVRAIDVMLQDSQAASQPSSPHIVVKVAIPKKYQLYQGAVVSVQSTVTGQSWLNFEQLGDIAAGPAPDPLVGLPGGLSVAISRLRSIAPKLDKTADEIHGLVVDARQMTLPKVNQTVDKFGKTATDFSETGQTATKTVSELRAYIKPIVDKYYVVADKAAGMMGEIKDVFGESKGDFKGTVANLNAATASVKQKLPGILDEVDALLTNVHTAVDHANGAMVDIRKTAENSKELTGTVRSVINGNKGKLDSMIASLKSTSDNLKGASGEIRRSPWRLLYKPGKNEVDNLNLYDSARQFADGANDLNDAALALRDALNNKSADERQIKKLLESLEGKFTSFREVEQKLWTEVRE